MEYTVIFFETLASQNNTNEESKNDWTKNNLQGKVRSLSEVSYKVEIHNKGMIKGIREREIGYFDVQEKFDKKGNLIELNQYNSEEYLENKYLFEYDEKGNKIKENRFDSEDSLKNKFTYKYDEKKNVVEKNIFNSDGELISKYTYEYKYDEKQNIIEEICYNSDGSLNSKDTYRYNEKGNKTERSNLFLNYKNIYQYDEKGNQVQLDNYLNGNLEDTCICKYDEKGNIIEQYVYNSKGNLISKYSYKYEFDKQGNWIKRIELKNEKPTYLLEREYEYYN